MAVRAVRGVVQHYAWGDPLALPELVGAEPDGRPWAELWFGTHPGGPATVVEAGQPDRPLAEVAGALPYLLKLLAARAPLSLQAHPTAEQAQVGFAREQSAGIPLTSPHRTYRDPFPKPELLVALTPFEALCGFRPVEHTLRLLASIGPPTAELSGRIGSDGLAGALRWLLEDAAPLEPIVDECRRLHGAAARWTVTLAELYPDDPAALAPLLLNHVELRPGEALFLGPGNLHAYLRGTAVEAMGSSDNVVRGGLTSKHVDVHELLELVDPSPVADPVLRPRRITEGLWRYDTPGTPFTVYGQHVRDEAVVHARGRELVLCARGQTDVLDRGEVAFLGPGEELGLRGLATLFRVSDAPAR